MPHSLPSMPQGDARKPEEAEGVPEKAERMPEEADRSASGSRSASSGMPGEADFRPADSLQPTVVHGRPSVHDAEEASRASSMTSPSSWRAVPPNQVVPDLSNNGWLWNLCKGMAWSSSSEPNRMISEPEKLGPASAGPSGDALPKTRALKGKDSPGRGSLTLGATPSFSRASSRSESPAGSLEAARSSLGAPVLLNEGGGLSLKNPTFRRQKVASPRQPLSPTGQHTKDQKGPGFAFPRPFRPLQRSSSASAARIKAAGDLRHASATTSSATEGHRSERSRTVGRDSSLLVSQPRQPDRRLSEGGAAPAAAFLSPEPISRASAAPRTATYTAAGTNAVGDVGAGMTGTPGAQLIALDAAATAPASAGPRLGTDGAGAASSSGDSVPGGPFPNPPASMGSVSGGARGLFSPLAEGLEGEQERRGGNGAAAGVMAPGAGSSRHALGGTSSAAQQHSRNRMQGKGNGSQGVTGHPDVGSDQPLLSIKFTTTLSVRRDESGRKTVNQYLRERVLGRGSYSKVNLYRNVDTGKLFAIKTSSKSRLRRIRVFGTETALSDVCREIEILSMCQHPNIVHLFEVIDDPNQDKLYEVLEFAEGGSLFTGTGPCGGIGEERSRECIRDAAQGLQYLHQAGVVHGDIKPDNLLVMADNRVKISDFDASTVLKSGEARIRRSPGTPVFNAPECCTGEPFNGKAADVWALGCTLFLCAFGRYPFLGTSMEATFEKILNTGLEVPSSASAGLRDVLHKLLCKDPEARISLEELLQHEWFLQVS